MFSDLSYSSRYLWRFDDRVMTRRSRSLSSAAKRTEPSVIDSKIWKSCAGSSVQIPIINSRVYYFPQGHMEQCTSPNRLGFSPIVYSKPWILCRISDIDFLADPETDEVFARLRLVPIKDLDHHSYSILVSPSLDPSRIQFDRLIVEAEEEDRIESFAKVLTPSDANNGGGFSIPKLCAESILPQLDTKADLPVQYLLMTDVHGDTYKFRHIYRGTPKRHLLTTGWSKFVDDKKLVANDSIVFMRNSRGGLFVGIRRVVRSTYDEDEAMLDWQSNGGMPRKMEEEGGCGETNVYSWSGKGRIPMEAVVEAAELAAQDKPFEVVYYPRAGRSDFVVRAEMVEKARDIIWSVGMRVKMLVETKDFSRMTWFRGTVSDFPVPNCGPWQRSPWRMLKVTWDEPNVLQNEKWVSPWQVECTGSDPLLTVFPPAKKLRVSYNSPLSTDEVGEIIPMAGSSNPPISHLDAPLFRVNTLPDGMQGARQNYILLSNKVNLTSQNTSQILTNNMVPKSGIVSPKLNLGSLHKENLSPDSQSIVSSFTMEINGNESCSSTKSSTRLFGKVIHMEQPVACGSSDTGSVENDGSKGNNETAGLSTELDLSLTLRYTGHKRQ